MSHLLGPDDLALFLHEHAPSAQLARDLGDTPTVPAAAAALGVEPDQIVKTLLFVIEGTRDPAGAPAAGARASAAAEANADQLVVVMSNGERRVDKRLLAAHFGVSKKRVTLAPASLVAALVGYAVGGVPPVGHRTRLPVLLDTSVEETAARCGGTLWAGGGDDHTMLRIELADLLRLLSPTRLPLSKQQGIDRG